MAFCKTIVVLKQIKHRQKKKKKKIRRTSVCAKHTKKVFFTYPLRIVFGLMRAQWNASYFCSFLRMLNVLQEELARLNGLWRCSHPNEYTQIRSLCRCISTTEIVYGGRMNIYIKREPKWADLSRSCLCLVKNDKPN